MIATEANQWTVGEVGEDNWVRLVPALYEGQDPFPEENDVLETPSKEDRVKP